VLGETTDGGKFVSAIARSRLLGVQFHPERSGLHGLRFLQNVVGLVRDDGFPRDIPSPAVEVVA
jgi:imidazoleglycerol phosphate synthase glutamine amidotransferase subunit HisH